MHTRVASIISTSSSILLLARNYIYIYIIIITTSYSIMWIIIICSSWYVLCTYAQSMHMHTLVL